MVRAVSITVLTLVTARASAQHLLDWDRMSAVEREAMSRTLDADEPHFVLLERDLQYRIDEEVTPVRERVVFSPRENRMLAIQSVRQAEFETFDLEARLEASVRRHREEHGALSTSLDAWVATAAPDEVKPVLVRMAISLPRINRAGLDPKDPWSQAEAESARLVRAVRTRFEQCADRLSDLTAGTVHPSLALDARGVNPWILCRLTGAMIASLKNEPLVDRVVEAPLAWDPPEDVAADGGPGVWSLFAQSIQWPSVEESWGNLGLDAMLTAWPADERETVTVAVVEPGSIPPSIAACFPELERMCASRPPRMHIAQTTALLAHHPDPGRPATGLAPDARIVLANDGDTDDMRWVETVEWARWRADIINLSWSPAGDCRTAQLNPRDLYLDDVASRYPWPLVVVSAGNLDAVCQTAPDGKPPFASGKGPNQLSVGNILNRPGGREGTWMSSSSLGRNPDSYSNHHEVPTLVVPGTRYRLRLDDEIVSYGQTSAATAAASALAAHVIRADHRLRLWPEAVRAVLVASADHDFVDAQAWTPGDDRCEGMGFAHGGRAVEIAQHVQQSGGAMPGAGVAWGYLDSSVTRNGASVWTGSLTGVRPGTKLRIAAAWMATVERLYPLVCELDLVIRDPRDPDGPPLCTTDARQTTLELLDETVPDDWPADLTVELRALYIPKDSSTGFGVAWRIDGPDA